MTFIELLLIILVALVVIKPKHLPEIIKQVGACVKWFRQVSLKLKNELGNVINDQTTGSK